MNSRFRFRAWHVKDGRMEYAAHLPGGEVNSIVLDLDGDALLLEENRIEDTAKVRSFWHEDIVIMQSTGLLDKHGKLIFEGDVVRWSDGDYKHPSNPRVAEVRFDPELCFFAFNVGESGHKFGFSNFIYKDTEKHLEVIGNVHENPELLTHLK